MTDLSRGPRSGRGGRRPGWLLLTALLILALAASSALVFTERVPLLRLAVILSLWAAAIAAFVSVIYRRQSDLDRAKARDLKLVYDLQLDREISARREYELEVESQLRRELASELRAQSADEVAALRAELAALRNNLEILFDADLSQRPAIEPERTTVRAYSDWERDAEITDPVGSMPRYVASTPRQDAEDDTENAIIDVPEEPPVPEEEVHVAVEAPPPEPAGEPEAEQPAHPVPPEPQPTGPGVGHGVQDGAEQQWQPVAAEGQWLPPGAPGSNWVSTNGTSPAGPTHPEPVSAEPGQGRHSHAFEPVEASSAPPEQQPTARHGASDDPDRGEGQGQSVADLLARLQSGSHPTRGGRRRRRDD
jgi:hypothetical protein